MRAVAGGAMVRGKEVKMWAREINIVEAILMSRLWHTILTDVA